MKRIILVITASILFGTAANARDMSQPATNRNNYTTEQINGALQFLGRPEHEQIGRARVLYDDNAGVSRSEIRIQSRTVNYNGH